MKRIPISQNVFFVLLINGFGERRLWYRFRYICYIMCGQHHAVLFWQPTYYFHITFTYIVFYGNKFCLSDFLAVQSIEGIARIT